MSDFWNSFISSSHLNAPSVLDEYLQTSPKKANASVYGITSKGREEQALPLPLVSGTRVAFCVSLESMMGTKNPPPNGHNGTVVMVRTASYGDITSLGDLVFVKWDRGDLQKVDRHYLQKAPNSLKRASCFISFDQSQFIKLADDSNDLIHKATQDLWSCSQTEGGDVVISRLFDETGGPLKV